MRTYLPAPPGYDALAHARAVAPSLGLRIPGKDEAAVAINLERTAGFAALLAGVAGIDDAEPAPVFDAGVRR